jgi:protein-tyrosine phosphatase
VIDLHTHLLPGIDDGPATMDETIAMARAAVEAGVSEVVATPHVSARYPNDPATIRDRLEQVRDALELARVPLHVHAGAEIAFDTVLALPAAQLHELRLGDGRFLMVESPLGSATSDATLVVSAVQDRGHRVLLAHPERSPMFQRNPELLERLLADGALTSLTASAFSGRFGRTAQRFATRLLSRGLVHNLVSDMHDLVARPPGIEAPPVPAGDDPERHAVRVAWLTASVPAAILGGATIPPGPALPPARRPSGPMPFLRRLARAGS